MLGHLKPGVTPAQAIADLNSIGSYLEKTYPKDDAQHDLFPGASKSCRRLSRAGRCKGFHDGLDAAGGVDSAGRVRQPGQPVCRPRRRPLARSCSAAGARIEPQAHSARSCSPKPC